MTYQVWPLVSLPRAAPLYYSYISEEKILKGALVKVIFRTKKVWGICLGEDKAPPSIKLQSIIETAPQFVLPEWCLTSIISASKIFLDTPINLAHDIFNKWLPAFNVPTLNATINNEPLTFNYEMKRVSRSDFTYLKNKIGDKKTLVLFPAAALAKSASQANIFSNLNIQLLLGSENKTGLGKIWLKNNENEINAIFGTRNVLFFPFTNLEQIIIWECAHGAYQETDRAPYYDFVYLAQIVARARKIKLFLIGPSLPILESRQKYAKSELKINQVAVNHKMTAAEPLSPSHLNYLNECVQENKIALIYHNHVVAKTTCFCRDCHSLSLNVMICDYCQSHNLTSWPNVNLHQIRKQLETTWPKIKIAELSGANETLDANKINVILASVLIFTIPLPWKSRLGCLLIPSLSSLAQKNNISATADIYGNLWQCYDLATSARAKIILGLNDKDLENWSHLATLDDEKNFWQKMIQDREKFNYPPTAARLEFSLAKLNPANEALLLSWLNPILTWPLKKLPPTIRLTPLQHLKLAQNMTNLKAATGLNLPKVTPAAYTHYYGLA